MATEPLQPAQTPVPQVAPAEQQASVPVHKPGQRGTTSAADLKEKKDVLAKKPFDMLLAIIFVLIIAGGLIFAVVESSRASFESKKEQYDQAVAQKRNAIELTPEQITIIEQGFIDGPGIVEFIQAVEAPEGYFRTLDLRFTSDEPLSRSGQRYLPFTLSLSGAISDVDGYIRTLLSSKYVIEIESITTTSSDGYENEMSVGLTGKLFISETYK